MAAALIVALCACGGSQTPPESGSEIHPEVTRVSDRVVVLSSLNVNVTAVRTSAGVILIDTGRSPSVTRRLLASVEEQLGRRDVRVVINTHGHWDHASGNQIFTDAALIGHESCPELMRQFPADSARNLWHQQAPLDDLRESAGAGEEGPGAASGPAGEIVARELLLEDLREAYEVTPPFIVFEDRLSFRVGDVPVTLLHAGETHTAGDVLVHLPDEGILLTGDLFNSPSSLGFGMNKMMEIPRLLAVLKEVTASGQGVRAVVPGHGSPMSGGDLASLVKMMEERYGALDPAPSAARVLMELAGEHGMSEALRRFEVIDGRGPRGSRLSEDEMDTLGYRLMGRGRIADAVAVLRAGIEALPGSSLLHDSLAEAYLKQNAIEAARASYERSLRLNPLNRNAEEMLKILARREER